MVLAILSRSPASAAGQSVLYEQKLDPYPFPILLPVKIEGNTHSFVLDTGSTTHNVDTSLKRFLGPHRESKTSQTAGRFVNMDFYDAPAITIGSWNLPRSDAGVFDCSQFRTISGLNIRGIIGLSALKQCALSLDYEHGLLKVSSGKMSIPVTMRSLKLAYNNAGVPMISQELAGKPMEFNLDTGDNNYIGLRHETFVEMAANGIISLDDEPGAISETASGTVMSLSGHFTKGQLLGFDLTNIPVDDTNLTNSIGIGFLLNFTTVIDFKNSEFFYQLRKATPPIRQNKMLGALLKFSEGRNHVSQFYFGSETAKDAGLKIWDRVLRLGSIREPDLNAISIYELCLRHAGENVDVEVQRPGTETPMVLRLKLPEKQFRYPPGS